MRKLTPINKARLIVFLNALTFIGGVVTIVLLLRVIGNAANQNAETNRQIVASQKATEKELGCLASFFSQTNRQTLVITSLEKCEVTHTDTGQTEQLKLVPIQTSPAVPDEKQSSTVTPTQTNENTTSLQSQASSQAAQQANVTVDDIQKPAKKLLGIALCVPFTSRCMR